MKKSIICGAASLAFAATSVVSAFAVGPGEQTKDVSVGEIDETIYSVDISWGDMIFDWKYNGDNDHDFRSPAQCTEIVYNGEDFEGEKIPAAEMYSDNACNSIASDPVSGNTYYRKEHVGDQIVVYDQSEFGAVTVQASFAPEAKYEWVDGEIGKYVNRGTYYFEEYEDGSFGRLSAAYSSSMGAAYYGYLRLEKNDLYTRSAQIGAGDKIGTVTLTISPYTGPILQ